MYATALIACGSIVLSFLCRLFFAHRAKNNLHKGMKSTTYYILTHPHKHTKTHEINLSRAPSYFFVPFVDHLPMF